MTGKSENKWKIGKLARKCVESRKNKLENGWKMRGKSENLLGNAWQIGNLAEKTLHVCISLNSDVIKKNDTAFVRILPSDAVGIQVGINIM